MCSGLLDGPIKQHMGTSRHINASTKNIRDSPGPIVLSKRLRSDALYESEIDCVNVMSTGRTWAIVCHVLHFQAPKTKIQLQSILNKCLDTSRLKKLADEPPVIKW
jgi:hypothetical protein